MSSKKKEGTREQVAKWLQKLERESWQLELLVSAFTIFLLIQAVGEFDDFYDHLAFEFNFNQSILLFFYLFLGLVGLSIKALTVFLIVHLLLRGFWIGAIGLRSVQSDIDFGSLNYSRYFTERLQSKVISLDRLVVVLDEICSVIFSFSFLVISTLISFGLYLIFLGSVTIGLAALGNIATGWVGTGLAFLAATLFFALLITGLLYMVDFFSLGFLKKFGRFAKIYTPIYRFYGIITVARITRSIYYYLISKFSKRKIRMLYLIIAILVLGNWFLDFDQYQYYSEEENRITISKNFYDNLRPANDHILTASVQSNVIEDPFLRLFVRYDPKDNDVIKGECPDFEPLKNDGFNAAMEFEVEDGDLHLRSRDNDKEDHYKLLECLTGIYEVSVNDSVFQDLKFYFYRHPSKDQRGVMTMISTKRLAEGENTIRIRKYTVDDQSKNRFGEFAYIPVWIAR